MAKAETSVLLSSSVQKEGKQVDVMNTTQMARTHAALTAMIGEKLLLKQEKRYGIITDGYIFPVPGSPEYCVMTITSDELRQRIVTITCEFPLAQTLLRELAGGGKYQDYREVSISSQDALRILAMFRSWVIINNLRHGNEQLSEPDPNSPDSSEPDLSVQYA